LGASNGSCRRPVAPPALVGDPGHFREEGSLMVVEWVADPRMVRQTNILYLISGSCSRRGIAVGTNVVIGRCKPRGQAKPPSNSDLGDLRGSQPPSANCSANLRCLHSVQVMSASNHSWCMQFGCLKIFVRGNGSPATVAATVAMSHFRATSDIIGAQAQSCFS